MKKNFLLIVILLLTGSIKNMALDCHTEGITLSAQMQTDSFPINDLGYDQFIEEMKIKAAYSENIRNLSGLSQITVASGDLKVWNNTLPESLNGFEGLVPIEKKGNKKSKDYKVWVIAVDNSFEYLGYLKEVEDNSIVLSKTTNGPEWEVIDIQTIETMKFRKNGSKNKGAVIGALSGALLGTGLAYLSGDDRSGVDCNRSSTSFSKKSGGSSPLRDFFGLGKGSSQKSSTSGSEGGCYTAGEKAQRNVVQLGLTGALIGSIAASGRIIIPINGKQKNYELRRPDLSAYKVIN